MKFCWLAYEPPMVEVVLLKTQSVLCFSGNTEDYINNDEPDWFSTEE